MNSTIIGGAGAKVVAVARAYLVAGKEDRISAFSPRSSWTWFMSDSTRTANVGLVGVMAPAHYSSK